MDGLCSSPLQQYLKIRHLYSSISDESMIRKKKSEARGRNFLASRTLSSSASQCPPPLDAFQATPFSAGPRCLVSVSPVSLLQVRMVITLVGLVRGAGRGW